MDRRLAQSRLEQRQAEIIESYPALWSQMMAAWREDSPTDRLWLMYSANYLVRSAGVRWAIDPILLASRLPSAPPVPVDDLQRLSFVLLTHSHTDHLDLNLIRALSHLTICWVVPQPLLEQVTSLGNLPREQLVVPEFGQVIHLSGIDILPFEGIHWQPGNRGVPTTAYLVTFNGKRWLFPGDTRTYDASLLPDFGPLDGLFAHVWLGRGCALLDEPPYFDSFCRFYMDLQPGRIVLTHLEELGREAEDYWDARHARMVLDRFQQLAPGLPVSYAFPGEGVDL
jgi:hypothetical protein